MFAIGVDTEIRSYLGAATTASLTPLRLESHLSHKSTADPFPPLSKFSGQFSAQSASCL